MNRGDLSFTNIDAVDNLVNYLCGLGNGGIANVDRVEAAIDKDDNNNTDDFTFNVGTSVYAVNIGNLDPVHIIGELIGDPIDQWPFKYYFQKHKLVN